MSDADEPNCYKCKNFYITWKPDIPYGCYAMEFESKKLPSQIVLEASGEVCLQFVSKPVAGDHGP